MSSTEAFSKFPEDIKQCQNEELIEDCSHRKLMKEAAEHCGCLPEFVNQFQNVLKVGIKLIFFLALKIQI